MARLYHPTASEGRQEQLLKKFSEAKYDMTTRGDCIFVQSLRKNVNAIETNFVPAGDEKN